MCTLGDRNYFGRLLFCAKHPTPQLVQTLHSSSGPPLTWGFTSTTTTTFKHAWVENLLNCWKWVGIYEYGEPTHQTHETPANYSSDPFKRLWHNVAKDALPVQKKVVNVWWGPRQQKIRFLTFISDYVLKDESIVQFGPTRIFKRQGSLGWWLDLPGRGFCDCGILFFASFSS